MYITDHVSHIELQAVVDGWQYVRKVCVSSLAYRALNKLTSLICWCTAGKKQVRQVSHMHVACCRGPGEWGRKDVLCHYCPYRCLLCGCWLWAEISSVVHCCGSLQWMCSMGHAVEINNREQLTFFKCFQRYSVFQFKFILTWTRGMKLKRVQLDGWWWQLFRWKLEEMSL